MLLVKLFQKICYPVKLMSEYVHNPLIIILGATGAGKSKLALEIGQHINGEIINADAMQMYQGLDIVTNKVTAEELKICPHHMIGFLPPLDQFNVVDFQRQTLKLIKEIHMRNRVPILVGGTNYYVESILWDNLLQSVKNHEVSTSSLDEFRKDLYKISSLELHKKLEEVDPSMAQITHPRDKRKIIRGLEVYYQSGKPMTEYLHDQRRQRGGSNLGDPLRFPRSCVMWVQCEKNVLCDRINHRVDKMLARGLIKELADFHEDFNKNRFEYDYEHGIFQSIGFKEFHDYLTCKNETEATKEKLLLQGVERMKLSTWQYAKYQEKFIKKRIVNRPISVPVYPLDGSDPDRWNELVTAPALRLLRCFYASNSDIASRLQDFASKDNLIPVPLEKTMKQSTDDCRVMKKCDICAGKVVAAAGWESEIHYEMYEVCPKNHLKSKKHKRMFGLLKKHRTETVEILTARQKQLMENSNKTEEIRNDQNLKLLEKGDVS